MSDILTAGSLIPSITNTPLDKRSRVAALSDIAGIENPFVGMIFYCTATGKHYVVKTLKSKTIGPATVANAQVDTYVELEASTVTGPLVLAKPENGSHLILKVAGQDGTRANATTLIDTLNTAATRSLVKGYLDTGTDGSWTICPASGFSSAYDDAPVAADLSSLTSLPATIYYAWYSDEDSTQLSDWKSMIYPSSGGAAAGTEAEQNRGSLIVSVVSTLPSSPDPCTLYLIPED